MISSRFPKNSEVFPSEFIVNLEDMFHCKNNRKKIKNSIIYFEIINSKCTKICFLLLSLFLFSRFSDQFMELCFDDVIQEFDEIQGEIIKDIYEAEIGK